jgi:hypothetical protein
MAATALSTSRVSGQQRDTILVGANVRISTGDGPYWEPVIAASTHGSRLAAAAFGDSDSGGMPLEFYWSIDGGLHWRRGATQPGDASVQEGGGDLAIVFGNGTFVYATSSSLTSHVGLSSKDGGRTWSSSVPLPRAGWGDWDREFLVSDHHAATGDGRLYVLGALGPGERVASSTDSGKSFTVGELACTRRPWRHTHSVPTPVVLSDGTIVVACSWFGTENLLDTAQKTELIGLATSTDRGRTFHPYQIVAMVPLPTALERLHDVVRGLTVSGTIVNSTAYLAADHSRGRFRDRLYLVWRTWTRGRWELVVATSQDRGRTWSPPHTVSSDTVGVIGPQMVAVNGGGALGIAWYDTRLDASGRGYDLYFTASVDGGASFLPAVRVTTATSWPSQMTNDRPRVLEANPGQHGGIIWSYEPVLDMRPAGGDYAQMVTDSAGTFHPIWVDARGGAWQAFTSAIRVTAVSPSHLPSEIHTEASLCPARLDDRLSLTIGRAVIDSAAAEVRIPVQVTNSSNDTIYGPIHVAVRGLRNPARGFHDMPTEWTMRFLPDSVWPPPRLLTDSATLGSDTATYTYVVPDSGTATLLPGDVTAAQSWRIRYGLPGGPPPSLVFETHTSGLVRANTGRIGTRRSTSEGCADTSAREAR